MSLYYRPSSPDDILSNELSSIPSGTLTAASTTRAALFGIGSSVANTSLPFDHVGTPRSRRGSEDDFWDDPFYARQAQQPLLFSRARFSQSQSPLHLYSYPAGTSQPEDEADQCLAASLLVETGSSPPSKPDSERWMASEDLGKVFTGGGEPIERTRGSPEGSWERQHENSGVTTKDTARPNRRGSAVTFFNTSAGFRSPLIEGPLFGLDSAPSSSRPSVLDDADLLDSSSSLSDDQNQICNDRCDVPDFDGDGWDTCNVSE